MDSRSMFQILGKQSHPLLLPRTFAQELRLKLSSSAAKALTLRRYRNARIFIRKHAQVRSALIHHSDVQATSEGTPITSASPSVTYNGWIEFAEKVSGEWDGFGANFTAEGLPIELPYSVVPDAYREWDVKVFDWQTQCPTLAELNLNCPDFMYKTIKLLPTVGCEADAATRYSIQERNVSAPHHSAFAYHSSGCYVAVWPSDNSFKSGNKVLKLEHSLVDPTDGESRVRVIQVLGFYGSELRLQNIELFIERRYGPFRNGDQLGGCASVSNAFATTKSLNASQVTGLWQGSNSIATFHKSQNAIQQLAEERVCQLIRNDTDLILLPKNLWSSVQKAANNETYCEVGWLLDHGQAITSKCTFSSTAEVMEIAVSASETVNSSDAGA